jgi:tRNA A-37 threonylcarbamoyl transferase component Bud32
LRQLVDVFHAEGLVHGDLWSPNILCNGDRLMLLNFDWEKRKGRCFAWMSSLTQS